MLNAQKKGTWMPNGLAWIGMTCAVLLCVGHAFAQTPGTFANTGSMQTARANYAAAMLPSGQVLVAGGNGVSGAELYSPTTGAFTSTGSMHSSRQYPTATLLPNGLVLVAGGYAGSSCLSSAELYNPSTGTFTTTGSMTTARGAQTATLLTNGMVLMAGGGCGYSILASAEIYNPSTGTFSSTGSMTAARESYTATLLPNGSVLVAGGLTSGFGGLSSAELYNPSTGTFTATGQMAAVRVWHTATLLGGNGKVLVAGGDSGSSAELYDPSSGTFTAAGNMTSSRSGHTATLLNNGTVLLAGGTNGTTGFVSSAEVYELTTGTFTATGSMNVPREYATATLLQNGFVLMAGGYNNTGYPVSSAELYDEGGVIGYVDPKFVVVGVTYAPPGPSPSTFVSYGNSTMIGTTNSVSQSFMSGDTFSVSLTYGVSVPKVGGGSISAQYSTNSSQTTKSSSSVTMSFQTSTAEKTSGTGSYWAPVNNDYDTIWVWLNPVAILTVSNNTVTWNGYGLDKTDQPGMDIVGIPLGYLNGHFGAMPPDIQTSLNRSWAANQMWPSGQGPALTSADLAQIASADPFNVSTYGPNNIGYDPPSPETPDFRFTMSACTNQASFEYLQAAPSQAPAVYSCTLTYTDNSTQAKDITTSYSQTFSVDVAFNASVWFVTISRELKNSNTLTWTTEEQSSITNSTTSTASFSVQGPPCNNQVQGQGPCVPVYDSSGNQPTQFYVYQDNMFATFMFAPVHYY